MGFSVNTITQSGASLFASATYLNRIRFQGCEVSSTQLTAEQARQQNSIIPTPHEEQITYYLTEDGRLDIVVMFPSIIPLIGMKTLLLYGHMDDGEPGVETVIAVCSGAVEIASEGAEQVINGFSARFSLGFSIDINTIEVPSTSGVVTREELQNEASIRATHDATTVHKCSLNDPTTGPVETIYGEKTFEDAVVFKSGVLPGALGCDLGQSNNSFAEGYINHVHSKEIDVLGTDGDIFGNNADRGVIKPTNNGGADLGTEDKMFNSAYAEYVYCRSLRCGDMGGVVGYPQGARIYIGDDDNPMENIASKGMTIKGSNFDGERGVILPSSDYGADLGTKQNCFNKLWVKTIKAYGEESNDTFNIDGTANKAVKDSRGNTICNTYYSSISIPASFGSDKSIKIKRPSDGTSTSLDATKLITNCLSGGRTPGKGSGGNDYVGQIAFIVCSAASSGTVLYPGETVTSPYIVNLTFPASGYEWGAVQAKRSSYASVGTIWMLLTQVHGLNGIALAIRTS